jgi:hypothetical protein
MVPAAVTVPRSNCGVRQDDHLTVQVVAHPIVSRVMNVSLLQTATRTSDESQSKLATFFVFDLSPGLVDFDGITSTVLPLWMFLSRSLVRCIDVRSIDISSRKSNFSLFLPDGWNCWTGFGGGTKLDEFQTTLGPSTACVSLNPIFPGVLKIESNHDRTSASA